MTGSAPSFSPLLRKTTGAERPAQTRKFTRSLALLKTNAFHSLRAALLTLLQEEKNEEKKGVVEEVVEEHFEVGPLQGSGWKRLIFPTSLSVGSATRSTSSTRTVYTWGCP